ncbi:MAG: S-layer homology domain-containing protein [Oscillospiraceae bacterium]|nr:S-layer homology domain-containing protein [Oscillospiraceae bacterium]
MNGTGNGRFSPDAAASRAMIVTILWRLDNEPQSAGEMPFLDVPEDAWYYEAVKWAANEGIVSGFSADSFAPDASINREQLAAILWRYAGKTGESTETELVQFEFSDSDIISDWALEAMRWAVSKGIINGVGNGRISPQGSAVRAQVATILMRFSLCV